MTQRITTQLARLCSSTQASANEAKDQLAQHEQLCGSGTQHQKPAHLEHKKSGGKAHKGKNGLKLWMTWTLLLPRGAAVML